MKYLSIGALNKSIVRIREDGVTYEHRTSTATLGLLRNYFSIDKFAITPEQIQEYTRKRPDYAIERYIANINNFVPHCFVEVKSLVNSDLRNIVNQLFDTLFVAVAEHGDLTGHYSVFMIGMKATKIAFYTYHSFSSLLNDYGIINHNGFIPLNYMIPEANYVEYCGHHALDADVLYTKYKERLDFETDHDALIRLGAENTSDIKHPHILDLLNKSNEDHIHNMFQFVANRNPNTMFPK